MVRAVLESRTFAKSTKLAQFLKFICLQTLDGNAREINEQQIGIHVFGRSPSYNAADDSIVRTQARLLRQRLEEYFEHEAPRTKLIITIPKGGYVPVFEAREPSTAAEQTPAAPEIVHAPSPAAASTTEQTAPNPRRAASGRWTFAAVIGMAFLLAGGWFWTAHRQRTSGADELWDRIFLEGRPVVIVASDDALVLFEEQEKRSVPLDEYLNGSYVNGVAAAGPVTMTSDWFAAHQYTSTADLNLTLRLGRLPAARNAEVESRNARAMRIDDLKGRNVILIGGLGANPWVALFLKRLDFEVNYDWKNHEGYALNKHPAKVEQSIYRDTVIEGTRHSYGVLAFLPGIEDQGEALLFEGTGMAGTESASDFPFNQRAFESFAKQIGATPHHLPYFEALLETTSIGGNAPEVHVITYHLIQP